MCKCYVNRRKKQSKKREISVSANMAYGQLRLESGGGEYKDPEKIRYDRGSYEQITMQNSTGINNECSGNKQMEDVYITTEDTCR